MTLFDMIAGGILLVSAIAGYVRGAAREVTTVVSLLVAIAAALVLLRW
jgi:membrane protein required for colicin V production